MEQLLKNFTSLSSLLSLVPRSFRSTQVQFHNTKKLAFSKFSRMAEEDFSRAAGFPETFPELLIVSRVVVSNPESRPSISLELGVITGLGRNV